MKDFVRRSIAATGVCALLAGVCGAAFAQTFSHVAPLAPPMHHAHRHIMRLRAHYVRDVAQGRYGAAERAHLKARAIRHAVRASHTP